MRQKGFALVPVTIIVVILFVVGAVVLKSFGNRSFTSIGKAVVCPDPFIFQLPVDIEKVTSVLYPGQVRGGDYKAHGGFRFDKSLPGEIVVTAPYDAQIIDGSRYIESGDVQYLFDFAHPCGIRYRFDHLLILSPKFQAIADKFPLPKESDTRTTVLNSPVEVKQGEVIATAVGLTKGGNGGIGENNTGVDWGVYDYRQKNESSKDPVWASNHTSEVHQYGVCWFDWISPENKAKIIALPPTDGKTGKTSDYCK